MANISIPNLPPVIALSGTEQIEVVQGGTSSRATLNQVTKYQEGAFVTFVDLASNEVGLGASLVGTTGGNTVQYELNRILYLKDFGGVFDGVTSNTAAIRAMLSAAGDGAVCQLTDHPDQIVGISDDGGGDSEALFVINKNISLILGGTSGKTQSGRGPYIKLLTDFSKNIFKVEAPDPLNPAGQQPGVTIDLTFSGYINGTSRRTIAGAALYMKQADFSTIRRLRGAYLGGSLIRVDRIIQGYLEDINAQYCGATGYPTFWCNGWQASVAAGLNDVNNAMQNCTLVGTRLENSVGAEALLIDEKDRANKWFGLGFEATGTSFPSGDFGFVVNKGYHNQFFGMTLNDHLWITSATAKLLDLSATFGSTYDGVSCVLSPNGARTSGDEIRLAGSGSTVMNVRGIANAGTYGVVLVRASGDRNTVENVYAYQCNPLALAGDYNNANIIKPELAQGTAVDVSGYGNDVTNIQIKSGYATAAPLVRVSGADCSVQGYIKNMAFQSTATAGVHLTAGAQRAVVDFNINGSCNDTDSDGISNRNRVGYAVLCEANDTNITVSARQIGKDVICTANQRPGQWWIKQAYNWGIQGANSYAAVRKTGASLSQGGSIRIGNLYPNNNTLPAAYEVAQTNWLIAPDVSAGVPSWQSLYASVDDHPSLTASISADASNAIVDNKAIKALAGAVGSSALTMSTARMLGRSTAGTGALEEISLDPSLSLSGGVLKSSVLIAQSAAAVTLTGTTTETTMATVTVPANVMGANGRIEIDVAWSHTNNANNKTEKVKFGGTSYSNVVTTTSSTNNQKLFIANRNATNSQTGQQAGGVGTTASPYGLGSVSYVTSAIDTTSAVSITFTGQLANTTDTIVLESYSVKLWR